MRIARATLDGITLLLLASVLLVDPPASRAQTFVQGQPLLANPQGTPQLTTDPAGTIVDAYLYTGGTPGNDICSKILNAWTSALPSGVNSVTIDARGFPPSSSSNCSVSPIPNPQYPVAPIYGRLLLGSQTIKTNAPWIIPSGVEVVGVGASSSGAPGTLIQASSVFQPDSTGALIEVGGDGTGANLQATDSKLRSVTVDCAGHCSIGVREQ